MTVPASAIPEPVRAEISRRLAVIEQHHDIRFILAVESGSRAWGFPSPDSDYDIRFVYVRRRDWYLSLTPGRDVIETPIADDIDLNGWDIRKALGLLLKSNAVIGEWIESPIRYLPDDSAVPLLASLADAMLDPRALAHHYANLGLNAAARWLDGEGDVPVKKYFYALRPALAIRCLRLQPTLRPPMNLQAMIEASDLAPPLATAIAELVEAKARTNEKSNGMRIEALDALIRDELGRAADLPRRPATVELHEAAEALFRNLVNQ